LGNCLLQRGRAAEAVAPLQKALALRPDYGPAHFNLGNAWLQVGRIDDAVAEFQKLLAMQPASAEARNAVAKIAWRLATSPVPAQRDGAKAVELARQANQLAGDADPRLIAIVAAACAEAGDLNQAVESARRALELAKGRNNTALAAAIEAQLKCYQSGAPFRDTAKAP